MKWISMIDIILLVIVIGSAFYGYKSGYKSFKKFSSYLLAIIGAKLMAPKTASILASNITLTEKVNNFVMKLPNVLFTVFSIVLTFILLKIVLSYSGKLFSNCMEISLPTKVNKALGLVLGIITGGMIATIGLFLKW